MRGDSIENSHHIIRVVSSSRLRREVLDDGTERVIGVLFTAFVMKPDEDFLSATWLEYFSGADEAQLAAAVAVIRKSVTCRGSTGFAIGEVGRIKAACLAKGQQIRVVHEPEADNDAHVAVRRYPREEAELFELLASDAWSQVVMNSDIA